MLNLLTLRLKDKQMEQMIRVERMEHFDRLFWWLAIPVVLSAMGQALLKSDWNWSEKVQFFTVAADLALFPLFILIWGVMRRTRAKIYAPILTIFFHLAYLLKYILQYSILSS